MRRRRGTVHRLLAVAATVGIVGASGGGVTAAAASGPVAHFAFGSDWPQHHHDGLGTGVDQSGTDLSPARAAWTANLDGPVFGEPLVEDGRVIVATENDTVYELAADTGQLIWSTHVGTPVPDSDLPCGDIHPTVGITGTPVIDPARSEVFAVADEDVGGAIGHYLVGLDLFTGTALLRQPVDPAGTTPVNELQRTGLALDNGQVVFGMGGNDGDCGQYWGYVIAVNESGGTAHDFQVDAVAGNHAGAIWMGGAAPVVDGQGNVWVASGNGFGSNPGSNPDDDSDAVLELSPSMQRIDYFAPSSWLNDNNNDFDLGSSAPGRSDQRRRLPGREVRDRVSHERLPSGRRGGPVGHRAAGIVLRGRRGRRERRRRRRRVRPLHGRDRGRAGLLAHVRQRAVADADRFAGTAGGGRRAGVDHQGKHPLRAEPRQRDGRAVVPAHGRGQPLPDPGRGRRTAAGAGVRCGGRLRRAQRAAPPPPPAPPRPGYWLAARDGGVFSFNPPFEGSVPGLGVHVNNIVGMAYDAATGGYSAGRG